LDGVRLLAATDVDVRLLGPRGAALGFAAQKGADEGQAQLLEQALTRWSSAVGRIDGRDISTRAGAGAAGGLGFALLAAGATWGAGIQTVLTASKLAQRMPAADLVVTGEGTLDWQSLQGKVVGGVAQLAREHRRPCLALAGRVTINPAESAAAGIFRAMSIVDDLKHRGQPPSAAFDEPDAHLSDLAESAARLWLRELRTERPS
jgi:glycerate kinase